MNNYLASYSEEKEEDICENFNNILFYVLIYIFNLINH